MRLESVIDRFASAEPPVLRSTATAVARLADEGDDVDARRLAGIIELDPLYSLRLLAGATRLSPDRDRGEVETVTAALLMLGTQRFWRDYAAPLTVEEVLAGEPAALASLRRVLRRTHRARVFAIGFAAHRQDPDVATVGCAALLQGFAEILLWCYEPALATEIQKRQRADSQLRSPQAQRDVLGFTLGELEQGLMRSWGLPRLLARLTDDAWSRDTQVRMVQLAVQFARHTQSGWSNAALPDDIAEVGALLGLTVAGARELLQQLDG